MSQIASFLGRGGGGMSSNEVLVEFKAGRMNFDGKSVVADKRRGTELLIYYELINYKSIWYTQLLLIY